MLVAVEAFVLKYSCFLIICLVFPSLCPLVVSDLISLQKTSLEPKPSPGRKVVRERRSPEA